MLYSMATTCWPYKKHMYFRVDQLQYVHRSWSVVYKVDYLVLRALSSSFVLFNTEVILLKNLNHNNMPGPPVQKTILCSSDIFSLTPIKACFL